MSPLARSRIKRGYMYYHKQAKPPQPEDLSWTNLSLYTYKDKFLSLHYHHNQMWKAYHSNNKNTIKNRYHPLLSEPRKICPKSKYHIQKPFLMYYNTNDIYLQIAHNAHRQKL